MAEYKVYYQRAEYDYWYVEADDAFDAMTKFYDNFSRSGHVPLEISYH